MFRDWNVLFPTLLAFVVVDEKPGAILASQSLYWSWHLCCSDFGILFLLDLCYPDHDDLYRVSSLVMTTWRSLYNLCLDISFFPKFGKFYIIIYLNCLSIPVYFTSILSSSHAPWSLRFALLNIILDFWKILSMLEKTIFLTPGCLCNTVSPSLSSINSVPLYSLIY